MFSALESSGRNDHIQKRYKPWYLVACTEEGKHSIISQLYLGRYTAYMKMNFLLPLFGVLVNFA